MRRGRAMANGKNGRRHPANGGRSVAEDTGFLIEAPGNQESEMRSRRSLRALLACATYSAFLVSWLLNFPCPRPTSSRSRCLWAGCDRAAAAGNTRIDV